MVSRTLNISSTKKLLTNKFLVGGFIAVTATVVGTAGIAAAHAGQDPYSGLTKVSLCKDHYKDFGFKNRGQCVSWYNHHHHGHGYGYGGNGHGHHHHGKHKGWGNPFGDFGHYFFGKLD